MSNEALLTRFAMILLISTVPCSCCYGVCYCCCTYYTVAYVFANFLKIWEKYLLESTRIKNI